MQHNFVQRGMTTRSCFIWENKYLSLEPERTLYWNFYR